MSVQYTPQLLQLSAAVEEVLDADPRDTPEVHRLGEVEQLLTLRNRLDAAMSQRLLVLDVDETLQKKDEAPAHG